MVLEIPAPDEPVHLDSVGLALTFEEIFPRNPASTESAAVLERALPCAASAMARCAAARGSDARSTRRAPPA